MTLFIIIDIKREFKKNCYFFLVLVIIFKHKREHSLFSSDNLIKIKIKEKKKRRRKRGRTKKLILQTFRNDHFDFMRNIKDDWRLKTTAINSFFSRKSIIWFNFFNFRFSSQKLSFLFKNLYSSKKIIEIAFIGKTNY